MSAPLRLRVPGRLAAGQPLPAARCRAVLQLVFCTSMSALAAKQSLHHAVKAAAGSIVQSRCTVLRLHISHRLHLHHQPVSANSDGTKPRKASLRAAQPASRQYVQQ